MSGVAAGGPKSGGWVEPHGHAPVPRGCEWAAPVVRERRLRGGRERPGERGREPGSNGGIAFVARVDRAPQTVWRSAAADRDAPVRGALRVEEQVMRVVDEQAAAPAEL